MTSATVGNVTELMVAPRADSVQSKKVDEDFAGSLKKAVEKGQKTGQDVIKKDFASKDSGRDGKLVSESSDSVKKPEEAQTETNVEEKNAVDQKRMVSQKEEITNDDDREVVSEMEEVMMTATLDVQTIAPLALDSENTELVTESVGQILEQLGETLGMSSEELSDSMTGLGFATADLFVPEKVTEMLTELTGIEDSISLVMDETLYQTWQDVNATAGNMVENLAKELDLTKEEVLQKIEEVVNAAETTQENEAIQMDQTTLQTQNVSENALEFDPEKLEKLGVQAFATEMANEVSDSKESQNVEIKNDQEQTTVPVGAEEQVDLVDKETLVVENTSGTPSEFMKQTSEGEEKTSAKAIPVRQETENKGSATQTPVSVENAADFNAQNRVTFNQPENTQVESFETMTHATQTEEIADQILEYMKVQMKEDVTELEMQLHPASLGNVHVSLVSREGNITAQFTAQNEAVKAVMETQLVQLKEQFEEQGIKVDAVEVAVSNHQFEKQYNGEEHRESQKNERNRVRTRRINLEELSEEELDKLLTDEEMLQADMMRKNGNTVDFMA